MPRYYFNVHDGVETSDEVGIDLPDVKSARREAMKYACVLLDEADERDSLGDEWRLDVTDAGGTVLFSLNFVVKENSPV